MEDGQLSAPRGASVWELQMFEHLTDHTRREGAMLADYAEVAATSESNALRYVINMLLEDERRHHRYFDELAMSLKSEAEFSAEEPVVPRLDFDRADSVELADLTNRLLENEKDDAKELRRLRKELHDVKDTTLWALLIDVMLRDTEKHMEILKFIKQHTPSKRTAR
jgi:hypothetical protein